MSTMAYCYHSLNMYLEMKEETDDMKRSVKMLFGLALGLTIGSMCSIELGIMPPV